MRRTGKCTPYEKQYSQGRQPAAGAGRHRPASTTRPASLSRSCSTCPSVAQAEEARAKLAAIVESSDDEIISKTLDGTIVTWNAGAARLFGYTAAEAVGQPNTMLVAPRAARRGPANCSNRLRSGERIEHFETDAHRQGRTAHRRGADHFADPRRQRAGSSAFRPSAATSPPASRPSKSASACWPPNRPRGPSRNASAASRMSSWPPCRTSCARRSTRSSAGRTCSSAATLSPAGSGARAGNHPAAAPRAQTQLIEDLLDMSRIISGKLRMDVQRVDLPAGHRRGDRSGPPGRRSQAGPLAESARLPTPGPSAAIPTGCSKSSGTCSPTQSSSRPREAACRSRWLAANSHVEIIVSDTGQGIAAEFLPHVFERFRQADSSTTRQHSGLGLGLAIVRHLVESHGGTVAVTSPGEGQGTTFTVSLPLMILHDPTERASRAPPAPAERSGRRPRARPERRQGAGRRRRTRLAACSSSACWKIGRPRCCTAAPPPRR